MQLQLPATEQAGDVSPAFRRIPAGGGGELLKITINTNIILLYDFYC